MSSYTDPNRKTSTDKGEVEGNPVFIYHSLLNKNADEVKDLEKRYKEGKVGDVEVKEKLVKAHINYFNEARKRRKELEKDPQNVKKILEEGSKKARKLASKTLSEVYETIGI